MHEASGGALWGAVREVWGSSPTFFFVLHALRLILMPSVHVGRPYPFTLNFDLLLAIALLINEFAQTLNRSTFRR